MNERRGRAFVVKLIHGIGQAWLLWGVTLLLFLGLEFAYRGFQGVRSGGSAPVVDSSQHPYAGQPWWPEVQRDLELRQNRFDPYRAHWSLPMASRYVNIDSLGRRVTPQPRVEGARRQLYLLGGSTTWGYPARDSSTIGAFLAAELHSRGLQDLEVVNLAQAAFNSTQETITLLSELAQGRIPALAVFLDGYNDIATAGKYGEPGHTYGDEGIQQQITRGRRGFWEELSGLGRHSAVVQRLRVTLGLQPLAASRPVPATVCGGVAGYYHNLTLMAEALGRNFGFPVVHFLQPHSAVSRKPKSAWEAKLQVPRLAPPCMAAIDSALADRRGTSFFSLVDLFDAESVTVFLDQNAHITEAANREVARRMADVIAPILARTERSRPAP